VASRAVQRSHPRLGSRQSNGQRKRDTDSPRTITPPAVQKSRATLRPRPGNATALRGRRCRSQAEIAHPEQRRTPVALPPKRRAAGTRAGNIGPAAAQPPWGRPTRPPRLRSAQAGAAQQAGTGPAEVLPPSRSTPSKHSANAPSAPTIPAQGRIASTGSGPERRRSRKAVGRRAASHPPAPGAPLAFAARASIATEAPATPGHKACR